MADLEVWAGPAVRGTMVIGEVAISPDTGIVRVNGAPIHFTPTEFSLLEALARWRGAIISRDALAAELYGEGGAKSPAHLDFYLHRVRRKLASACPDKRYLSHVPDTGYILFDWSCEAARPQA